MIIEKLVAWMENAPAEMRAKAADALVRAWHLSDLDDHEREAADAAMTCLLDDPSEDVRLSLSRALSDISDPPRHLIIALANDEPAVSLPVLCHSASLVDSELVRLIETGTDEQQMAIAKRPFLSPVTSQALAFMACRGACLVLLTNPNALIGEAAFFELATRFSACPAVRRCMLARPDIGMRSRTLLIEAYAASLVPEEEAQTERRSREIRENAERAIITYAAQLGDHECRDVVQALIDRDRLTTAFLLRAICLGNLNLFCHALSLLSGQSADRVERVLKDLRANAFHAIYAKASMPASAETVFFSALRSWYHHLSRNNDLESARLQYLVTREVLGAYEGKRDAVVDELLVLLRRICTDAARESARVKVGELALQHEMQIALPAPEPVHDDLSPEELQLFAEHLADELAELALQDEYHLAEERERLEPANAELPGTATCRSSLLHKAVPPVDPVDIAA